MEYAFPEVISALVKRKDGIMMWATRSTSSMTVERFMWVRYISILNKKRKVDTLFTVRMAQLRKKNIEAWLF